MAHNNDVLLEAVLSVNGEGQCGSCIVHVAGRAARSWELQMRAGDDALMNPGLLADDEAGQPS